METKRIYLDNAATTSVRPEVLEAMLPWFTEDFGNASSVHSFGRKSTRAVDEAREKVAKALGAIASEIYFTSGGTEADNWAVKGYALKHKDKGSHLITSSIEHHAVLHTFEILKKQGFEVTLLPIDSMGIVQPESLKAAMRPDTILVSVMTANNEIGTIQPIAELAKIAHAGGAAFHTDAVQAVGHIPVNVKDLGVDMLTLSAHKFHGPKGIGALYIHRGLSLDNLIDGGAHERGRRAGTLNHPGIIGLARALELSVAELPESTPRLITLRDRLIKGILDSIPNARLNGHPTLRLPGNANFSFSGMEGEALVLSLDIAGIAASSGSACSSGSLEPSHVLMALGIPIGAAHSSLRLSLGENNTEEDIDYTIAKTTQIIERLRAMSPIA
jgi:cysteine desulfurase